ncbi:hypothetical protein FACS1894104_3840 [Actinomycetota bacterium]|nr:hypothetical protein FACS1894104_3840 [Actinomycetota bacterium]
MDIKVVFASGNIASWSPTYLSVADGFVIEGSYLHLSLEEIVQNGLVLDRSGHILDVEFNDQAEPILAQEVQFNNVLVPPEQIDDIQDIYVDGSLELYRNNEGTLVKNR